MLASAAHTLKSEVTKRLITKAYGAAHFTLSPRAAPGAHTEA